MSYKSTEFRKLVSNKFKFGLYMLTKLPSAFFSGVRVKKITQNAAEVTIPYKFFTKNPFKSVYFASQAMAAELSTGVLALQCVYKQKPAVSMLVLEMKAEFKTKARSKIRFTCEAGNKISDAVEKTIATGEGVTVEVKTTGRDKFGDVVSEFVFVWTFKQKSRQSNRS